MPLSDIQPHCLFALCTATQVQRVCFVGDCFLDLCAEHEDWLLGAQEAVPIIAVSSDEERAVA